MLKLYLVIILRAEDIIFSYKKKGLSDIGICKADGFEFLRNDLEARNKFLSGFVEQDIDKRLYPCLTMPEAKSIIACAMPYIKKRPASDGALRVDISMGAVGEDYHITLKNILEDMAEDLRNSFGAKCKTFVDTGPLSDRSVAAKAGIGYIGKNGSLVSHCCGSGVFLGYILTDMELNETSSKDIDCGSCNKCICACPTNALSERGFELDRCISYITQKKGLLSEKEMELIGINIYGCDNCHRLCAKTKIIDETILIDDIMPKALDILSLDNKGFKARFGNTAMSFRGRNIIRRNTLCALSNIRTKESMELISGFINDESDIVSHTAKKAYEIVKNSLEK